MRTLSVQQMPGGYELETPTFWYWMRAGAAFTLGAAVVYVLSTVVWFLLLSQVPTLVALRAIGR